MLDIVPDIMDRRLADLLARWRQAPSPDDPLACLADHADHLLVIDAEGSHNRYSHYGAAFARTFGADLTGQVVDALPSDVLPEARRGILGFEYAFVRRVGRPLWRSYTAEFEPGRTETWQRLVLPAGGDRLIVGAYRVEAETPGDGLLRLVIGKVPVVLDEWGRVVDLALSLEAFSTTSQKVAELEELASRDPLTGIANLRHFRHLATLELDHARLMDRSFSVLALDIDHFKRINDGWGHAIGDQALKTFAAACTGALREYDILGRCGGEEFAVALPNTGLEGAGVIAERLRQQVARAEVPLPDGTKLRFTVSIGVATADRAPDLGSLLDQADKALYRAKRDGRNRVAVAD